MTLPQDNITINAVAPASTATPLLPVSFAARVTAAGQPVSLADVVGLALVYSATAQETRRVEDYGKDRDAGDTYNGRWNSRVILTLGDQYTELEEPIADSRAMWLGAENARAMRAQQAATDTRKGVGDTSSS